MRDNGFYFCTRMRLHGQLEQAGFHGEPFASPWVAGWVAWAYRRTAELNDFLTQFYNNLEAQKAAAKVEQDGGADNG